MRSRSIKPSICDNEVLGTADLVYTVLFERLWMMADREGRLEDRPLRIKAQAFPYRDGLDVDPLLGWLHEHGFIQRYTVDGKPYIQISTFAKHQSPHVKEAPSTIPAPDSPGASTRPHPEKPAPAALTPSSLTPDSRLLTPDNRVPAQKARAAVVVLHESLPTEEWEQWIQHRRKRRWPVDEITLRKQLDLLKQFDTEIQRRIIDNSINSGWQGLFAPKGRGPPTASREAPTVAELEVLETRRLSGQGRTASEIANELAMPLEQVQAILRNGHARQ